MNRPETASGRIEHEYIARMKIIDANYEAQKAKNYRLYKRQNWFILIAFVVFLVAIFILDVVKA